MVARYTRPQRTWYKADTRALCVRSVLSWPYPDLAGDIVDLDGIDFTPHQSHCEIDLEHGRTHLKAYPVAWARESLSRPGAPYAVERVYMDLAGPGEPEEWHTVPIGTSYFDPSDRISHQTFALVEQGLLPAVSGEFRMVRNCYKALGPSPLEPRPAYRFTKSLWDKWTLCARPVNGGAMHLEDDTITKARAVPNGLAKILHDRRISVGGLMEPLHGRLLKALADTIEPSTTTTAHIRWGKAMEPDDDDMDLGADGFPDEGGTGADDLTPEMDEGMDEGAPAKPTVQAHYDAAQSLLDIVDKAEADLQSSEHVKGKAFLTKKLEAIRKLAEELKGMGDKIDGELSGKMDAAAEPDGDEDGSEPSDNDGDAPGDDEDDDEKKPFGKAVKMDRDSDGVLTSVRPVYKAQLRTILKAQPRRLKVSKVEKAKEDNAKRAAEVAERLRAKLS